MEVVVLLTAFSLFTLLAAGCSILFNKLRLPPLIGYIVAGIILVNVLFLYQGQENIEAEQEIISILKDLGLVMLLFCIGLEINIKKIRKQGAFAILIVAIQLPLMIVGGFIGGTFMGFDLTQCIVLGAIISGSSTAAVMAVLKAQSRLDKEHKEMLVLVLIMEDIGQVIILSIITPLMANYSAGVMGGGMDFGDILALIIKIVVFMIVSIVIGLRVVPKVINWIADNVSDEILTVASIGLAFSMALLAVYAGLSMAIGAFLMGMMVASSRKAKDINHKIEPMRDLFMAIFFISIGAEVYPVTTLLDNLGMVLIIYLMFTVLIISSVFLAYWVGNGSCRNGFLSATGLCAIGEFAFIIAAEALSLNVINDALYTSVIGAALLSMVMLPIISQYADRIWDKSVEKCPAKLMDRFERINAARSRVYSRFSITSKKSQKAVFRSLTHAYINVLLIVATEVVFYFALPPMASWCHGSFGGDLEFWNFFVMLLNFIVLSLPIYYLITNVKFLDEIVIRGAKRIANRDTKKKQTNVYQKFLNFLELNTYAMVVGIDLIIILVVPNAVDINLWYYVLILVLAAVTIVVLFYNHKHKKEQEEGAPADDIEPELSE